MYIIKTKRHCIIISQVLNDEGPQLLDRAGTCDNALRNLKESTDEVVEMNNKLEDYLWADGSQLTDAMIHEMLHEVVAPYKALHVLCEDFAI